MLAIHNLTHIKIEMFTLFSLVAGMVSSAILFFQGDVGGWYLNAGMILTFIVAMIPATALLVLKLIDVWQERQKRKQAKEEEDDAGHLSYGERLVTESLAERARLLSEREKNHQTEIRFYKYQLEIKEIETIESRFRAHFHGNELSRAQAHISVCQGLMANAGLEIPEFKLKTEAEMQIALQAELANYRKKLEKEKEAMIHFE
jgi:hypothetical protein